MSQSWYLIRSKPKKEFFLASQLESRNFKIYLPLLRVKPINPRCRKIVPFFPGYLFFLANLEKSSPMIFERIPGAIGLVYIGGEVALVPEKILDGIKNKIDYMEQNEINPIFKKGEKVTIKSGMFSGYDAVFDVSLSGKERVQVLIKMLRGYQVKVQLPVTSINKQTIR
jgi:transcription antitermination factor NusG